MTKIKSAKTYGRILEVSKDSLQITMPDSRFYRRNGAYYPSITHVLSYYPKGKYFEDWLKKVGYSADYIVKEAGKRGTIVHEMIEAYLEGDELVLLVNGKLQYKIDEWQMFLKFVEFWDLYKPTILETEVHLFSDKYKIAGTCDLICLINDELWIIDFKTSNHLQTTYDLQTAAYSQCYEECFGEKPKRHGILWLNSNKRKVSIPRMQGKGWEMYESSRTQEENLDLFMTVKKLFDLENPNPKPVINQFKTSAKLPKIISE
jgi:hypothetical protein